MKSIRPYDWRDKCAACRKQMDVNRPFFICRECLAKLPDDLRTHVLSAETWQHEPRVDALKFLGAANTSDVRCAPKPREKLRLLCRCDEATRKTAIQAGMFRKDEEQCRKCARPIR